MNEQRITSIRRRPLTRCLLTVLALGGLADTATASTYEQATSLPHTLPNGGLPVTSCADDGGAGTLRSVVATAVSGDTIDLTQLDCGTITLQTGQIEIHLDDLTIDGPGEAVLTIDGNSNGRVFLHDGGGTLSLSGLTIAHGIADFTKLNPDYELGGRGGCILSYLAGSENSDYGSVTLVDSTVTACQVVATEADIDGAYAITAEGGGINASGDITLYRSTVSDNKVVCAGCVATDGGGVSSRYGVVRITDSAITNNRSIGYDVAASFWSPQAHAGGIRAYAGAVISGSIISGNFAGCDTDMQTCSGALGGGVWADGVVHPVQITSSQIHGNVAQAAKAAFAPVNGGGLYLTGQITIENSAISGNLAQGPVSHRWGGGIAFNGTALVAGSVIDNNQADIGGGIVDIGGSLNLVDSTVSSNIASSSGGAIYAWNFPIYGAEPLVVDNSTITLNISNGNQGGGGIVDNHDLGLGLSDFESSIVAGNVNTVAGASYDADLGSSQPNASVTGANNLIVGASGVTLPPDTLDSDPMLGPLQNNGGPTFTHAILAGSPATDAGNNSAALSFDQRGTGFRRVSGNAADIGAFEVQQPVVDAIFSNGFDSP